MSTGLTVAATEPGTAAHPAAIGRFSRVLADRRLATGLGIVTFFVLTAILGPLFVHNADQFGNAQYAPPSASHWLGTTQTGQDVFAQVIVSARASMEIGFAAGLLATVVSVLIGITGGYLGGVVDEAFSLLSNVFLVIPTLPLVIVISAYVKANGLLSLVLIIALTSWAASARVLRAQTLSVRSRDYVLASRATGERAWRIVLVEIVPNELPIIVSQFIFAVVFAILTQAGLAFLGLGDVNLLTWGNMLYYAQNDQALQVGAWWWFVPPGLCIALLGMGLTLVNLGLDETLNPALRVHRAGRAGRVARRGRTQP
jgi:peptide/nickel transport system permease protein